MNDNIDYNALWKLSYGLYIVASCSADGSQMNGQIANAVAQVTAEPPKLVVAINKKNLTHQLIEESGVFSVSVLDITADMKFIGTFGFRSGRDIDKLSTCKWKKLETGCPAVVDHAASILGAKLLDIMDAGTHTVFLGEVVYAEIVNDNKLMSYEYYHNVLKGRESKNAPAFRGAKTEDNKPKGKK